MLTSPRAMPPTRKAGTPIAAGSPSGTSFGSPARSLMCCSKTAEWLICTPPAPARRCTPGTVDRLVPVGGRRRPQQSAVHSAPYPFRDRSTPELRGHTIGPEEGTIEGESLESGLREWADEALGEVAKRSAEALHVHVGNVSDDLQRGQPGGGHSPTRRVVRDRRV